MLQTDSVTEVSALIRNTIKAFINDRLQSKLAKLSVENHETRESLVAAHTFNNWIADAARRVTQIQQVTHAIKFTHPSADGSSLSNKGNLAADTLELGSHNLPCDTPDDIVGNAAALDVYKFLRLEVANRSLLQRAIERDPALLAALHENPTEASGWVEAFASLSESKGCFASHKLAKQIYWPVEQDSYHLLAPLLSSPLAHALYRQINDARFSETAKAARNARRNGKPYPHGYRDYPGLAIQKFGGSKPQNISQLNSERRGENFLLASLPPQWTSTTVHPPLKTKSVFLRYYPNRREIRRLAGFLKDFLRKVAKRRSNVHIRHTRATLVAELVDELLNMAAELHISQPPGWTAQANCQLNLSEQRWLDPRRTQIDAEFAARTVDDAWQDDICHGFANWLNAALETDKTLFSDDEAHEWRKVLKSEIHLLRESLTDD